MNSINGMAEKLRAALTGPDYLEVPGCYDVLSAILLEQAGFRSVFLSGYGVSASTFGNPDIGLTALPETALMTRNVSDRIGIPLLVDADNGYGNESNALRTVYELEHAGAAGMIMEDQILPKQCGHTDNKKTVPLDHYLKKLETVLNGRKTPLVVVARTDCSDIEEGIKRAKAFHAAGADVVMVEALRTKEDMKRMTESVPGPKLINVIYGGKTPVLSAAEYQQLGFKLVLYSTPALFVAAHHLKLALSKLWSTHDLKSIGPESVPFKEFQAMIEKVYAARTQPGPKG